MSTQGQPEDQPPADGAAEDQPDGDDTAPTDEERIAQITERIDKARTRAEDAGVLEDTDDQEYVESGATEEEDNQTITPPG